MRTSSTLRAIAFGLAIVILHAPQAGAAWGLDGAPASTTTGTPQLVGAIPDGAGGMFVAWDEASTTGFVQRISGTGVVLWTITLTSYRPAICSDGAGGAIVTSIKEGGTFSNIYVQRYSPAGGAMWAPGGVALTSNTGPTVARAPSICADGAGGAFVAWDTGGISFADVKAQHVNAAGTPLWTAGGVAVTALPSTAETDVAIATGQSGTAVLTWNDTRNAGSTPDLYAQRINDPSGTASWAANGVPVCTASNVQADYRLIGDGAGAYVAWSDQRAGSGNYNAYMQRLAAADGASLWGADGKLITTNGSGIKLRPAIVPSGTGILVAWQDHRNGLADIYAQRFDNSGAGIWGSEVRMTDLSNHQDFPIGTPDGTGGAFVAYRDLRTAGPTFGMMGHIDGTGTLVWGMNGTFTNVTSTTSPSQVVAIVPDGAAGAVGALVENGPGGTDLFGQRVAASSNLADYDAKISVADIPGDEGGRMRIAFSAAIGDATPGTPPVTGYTVWHQVPPGGAAPFGANHRARGLAALASREIGAVLDRDAAMAVGFPSGIWESAGFTSAISRPSYLIAVSTPTDSTALSVADQSYVVSVSSTSSAVYGISNTATGHSVDNLAPGAPFSLTGTMIGTGTVRLDWSATPPGDFYSYAVYRGATSGFLPSPGNRIGTPTAATFTDAGFANSFYKVTAVDRHGNESSFAALAAGQITGGGGEAAPKVTYLARPYPNPFGQRTEVELGLAAAGHVTLRVYDIHGRVVRTLEDVERAPEIQHMTWDGRDDAGREVAAGLYVLRFRAPGYAASRRLMLVR